MDKESHVYVHVSATSVLKTLLLLSLFIAVFYLRETVVVFLAAVVIASAIEPIVNWAVRHKFPRLLSVVFMYAAVIILVAGTFYILLPPLFADLLSLLNTLPKYFDYSLFGGEAAFVGFKSTIETLAGNITLRDALINFSKGLSTSESTSAGIFRTASDVFSGAMSLILIFFVSFYLSAQADGVEKFLQLVTPKKHENYIIGLWRRTQKKIGYWLQGQFVLAIFVGLLVWFALSIVGIRHALLLGVISAVFEIIPVFGPIFGAIPGIAIALLDGGLTLGLLVSGLYIAIQQFESNVMYPIVVKKIVGIPPLLVILALLVGYQLGGFLGAILAVPLATVLVEYIDDIQQRRRADSVPVEIE